jgi:hypothetical protein
MGRTIPSFRLASGEEEREWKIFRDALDKSDRKIFDEMFSISDLSNSVCSYANLDLSEKGHPASFF